MIPSEAIVTGQDKLDIFQRLDRRRHVAGEGLCCTRCDRMFAVSEIAVLGGSRGFGPLRLHCPNEKCDAPAAEWMWCPERDGQGTTSEFSHNGRVCFVRRMKRLTSGDQASDVGPKRGAGVIVTALRRLDANWAALWHRFGTGVRPAVDTEEPLG
ncbi:MAG: hypothetical protein ACR2FX_02060 [Chthoniobacterales bacterium]